MNCSKNRQKLHIPRGRPNVGFGYGFGAECGEFLTFGQYSVSAECGFATSA